MDVAEEQRFTAWATTRVGRLHRTAYLLCGDWQVAEDLVQESLAKAASNWPRIEKMAEPDAYVRRILVNHARARARRRSTRERPVMSLPDSGTSDGADTRADRDELMAALAALPPRQRAAVVLRYFEELSEAETAEALGCAAGTVKSQTSRALVSLKRALSHQESPC